MSRLAEDLMTAGSNAASGKAAAALALHRFGFGPAGDSIDRITADPRGAVLADLDRPNAGRLNVDLPSSGEAARELFDFRATQQAKQKLAQRAKKAAEADGMTPTAAAAEKNETLSDVAAPGIKEPPLPQGSSRRKPRRVSPPPLRRISALSNGCVVLVEPFLRLR
jgi:uncharacterized protein (DUF1800 family)